MPENQKYTGVAINRLFPCSTRTIVQKIMEIGKWSSKQR